MPDETLTPDDGVSALIADAVDASAKPDESAAVESIASAMAEAQSEATQPDDRTAETTRKRRSNAGRHPANCQCPIHGGAKPVAEVAAPKRSQTAKTKREALDALAAVERELEALHDEAKRLRSMQDGDAMARLSLSIAFAGKMGAAIVAAKRGPHWELKEAEAKQLGDAWAIVAAPYAEQLGDSMPWVNALIVTAHVFGVRIMEDQAMQAKKRADGAS